MSKRDKWYQYHLRRCARGSKLGRDLEKRVESIGLKLVAEGLLDAFHYHTPNSAEDCDGRDFTAELGGVSKSFGITHSEGNRALEAQFKHHKHPQWWVPWNTKDETIRKKILGLFA